MLSEERGASDDKFASGKLVWQKYNCNSCHQLYGLGGFLGPDLTHVDKRGGAIYVKAIVSTGTSGMPAFRLDSAEMDALLYFFKTMNESGNADPRKFSIDKDGFISTR